MLSGNEVDGDSLLVDKLVEAAKFGRWEVVWSIIGTPETPSNKVHFINVIPQNRRWGVIHQAIYWNNVKVIKTLLRFKACDKHMLTKPCTSENIGVTERLSPHSLAEQLGNTEIAKLFTDALRIDHTQDIDTYQECSGFQRSHQLKLLEVSIAAYKKAFHPTKIDTRHDVRHILGAIWVEMNRSEARWKEIRDVVADSVYLVCTEYGERIGKCHNLRQLYNCIIRVYTDEQNYMYSFLSTAFRKETNATYMPSGEDLALGPYAVLFQMMLLFWPNIKQESQMTYRRMLLSTADITKYKNGVTFVWPSIVSSSVVEAYAVAFPTCGPSHTSGEQAVLFIIDNSTPCVWRPRNIENYATYTEKERTYPAGAMFQVVRCVKQGTTTVVHLKLIAA